MAADPALAGRFVAFSPLPGQTLPVRARFVAFLLFVASSPRRT